MHGIAFTAERKAKTMYNLVKDKTECIDSRFLEPACGDGNFLVKILTRKLAVVRKNTVRHLIHAPLTFSSIFDQ